VLSCNVHDPKITFKPTSFSKQCSYEIPPAAGKIFNWTMNTYAQNGAPGMVPIEISGWPNEALSPAYTISHIIASSQPPPSYTSQHTTTQISILYWYLLVSIFLRQ